MSLESLQNPPGGRNPITWLLGWRRAWLGMDGNDRAIAFAGTLPGILVIHAGFLLTLAVSLNMSKALLALTAVALAGCALWPKRRKLIVVGAGLFYLALRPFRVAEWTQTLQDLAASIAVPAMTLQVAAVFGFLIIAWSALELQRRFSGQMAAKRPVRSMIGVFLAFVVIAAMLDPGTNRSQRALGRIGRLGLVFLVSVLRPDRPENRRPDRQRATSWPDAPVLERQCGTDRQGFRLSVEIRS